MIDYLLFNVQQQIFYAYSGREQVQQYLIYICIEIQEGLTHPRQRLLIVIGKVLRVVLELNNAAISYHSVQTFNSLINKNKQNGDGQQLS